MLIGRDADIGLAVETLHRNGSVLVVGEAGVGKTALLDAALDELGRPVRTGQCFRSLSWTAALPLQQAFGAPIPTGDPAWTAQSMSARLGAAVLRLEDVQWADALTLDVATLLAANVPVAASVRLGDPGADAVVTAFAASRIQTIELHPLDQADATELARARFPRLRASEAAALARRCDGNPLLIEELGRDAEPSSTLRRSIAARLRRLDPQAWTDFALLAAAGEPVPADWFPELEALARAGLVDRTTARDDGQILPRHALLAEVVLAELSDAAQGSAPVYLDLAGRAERGGRLGARRAQSRRRRRARPGDHDRDRGSRREHPSG